MLLRINMDRLTNIIIIFLLLAVGCTDEEIGDKVEFQVSVSDISAYTAKITVKHNATNRDAYYGFAVEGTVTDMQAKIHEYLSDNEKDLTASVHYQRKSVYSISHLLPGKTYTYIIFGMRDDGEIYGKPAAVEFTTIKSNLRAELNPNWNIKYRGYTVYKNTDYSLVTVTLNGDVEERFFLATYASEFAEKFDRVEDLLEYASYEMLEEKDGTYWLEDNEIRTEGTDFYRYLSEGDYVFYAIGINADGSPTGHFVCTPTVHVDKYPACEAYSNLLGEWVMIDEDDKWYFVTFSERVVNRSLTMTGWGNYPNYPINVVFDRSDGSFKINSQIIFENDKIELKDGSLYIGTLKFLGAYYNLESNLKWTTNSSLTLAKAMINDNGTYSITTGYYVTLSNGERSYDTGISYYGESTDGVKFGFSRMMFPITMKKLDDL